jgi:pyruvate formate lyase activating enzyme
MTTKEARWWHTSDSGHIVCDLCPRHCSLSEGMEGFCRVRKVEQGKLITYLHNATSGFAVDPVEKKPLFHFLPASNTFSFGTASCNLACSFCQNYGITTGKISTIIHENASAEDIVLNAQEARCQSISFTYNEPTISAEFCIEVAAEAHKKRIRTVAVTNGFIAPGAREEFFSCIDAANIDLKAFSEEFYSRQCLGSLKPVLDTLDYVANKSNTWLEVTTLLIPGLNDSEKEISQLSSWFVEHLGPNVPLHFSAFHPAHKLLDRPKTPKDILIRARDIAVRSGIHHVYLGNIPSNLGSNTQCPHCNSILIERNGFSVTVNRLIAGKCQKCGTVLAGIFVKS